MEHNKLRAPLQTEEVENNWAISYGDMITLLLGFFVLFFNIRTETMNLTLLKKDLDKYFDSSHSGPSQRAIAQVDDPGDQKTAPILTSDISNVLQIKSNIQGERILVEFPGVSFFKSASHKLTTEGEKALTDFARAIHSHLGLFRLVVRGYTDGLTLSPSSIYKDNLELSAFRSISAIRFLSQKGVALGNMRIAGYGESSADRSEAGPDNFKTQRKVVIVIEPLDHTESAPKSGNDSFSHGKKPIEAVQSASIKDRQPTSAAKGSFSATLTNISMTEVWKEIDNTFEEYMQSLDKLKPTHLYRSYVDYLVKRKLKQEGYSDEEIETKIRLYRNKEEKRR